MRKALFVLLFFAIAYSSFQPQPAHTASPNIVISQVYGAGGNSGATWRNDYIELFNRGNAPVSLSGWSVQYAAATGSTWSKTDLSGTLQPGQYLLVQQGSGGANGALLPAAEVTGTIAMAATAGKVALLNTTTVITLGTSCPSGASLVDFVGYGTTANCFEGAGRAPAPSATNAVFRAANGCTDNDDNSADFAAAAAMPRNTASPVAPCSPSTPPTGVAIATPNPIIHGNAVLLTVTVTPGTVPPSTGLAVTANLTSIGGTGAQALLDDGTNGDVTANDNVFSLLFNIATSVTPAIKLLPFTISDAQSRSSATNTTLDVRAPLIPGDVVISQVYGGGGNSGAPYRNDFVELFNRSNTTINLAGWSLQYAASTSGTWSKLDLTGTLAPGQYCLIQLDSGGTNGAPLPAPDIVGTLSLAATAGKVALLNNNTLIASGVNCPSGGGLVDFVGYGATANCFEGTVPAPAPSNEESILRAGGGCADTNANHLNFAVAAPLPRNRATALNSCSGAAMFDTNSSTLTLDGADECLGPGVIINGTTQLANLGTRAQGDNPGNEYVAQLAPGLVLLAGSCVALGGGSCTIAGNELQWNGAIDVGATITLQWQVQITDEAATGAPLCANATLNYDSNNDGVNDAALNWQACRTVTCASVAPGAVFPSRSEASGQKAGSLLVYPLYSSDAANPARENARLSLTNANPSRPIAVHLFFIEHDSSHVADSFICLTPNQTVSVLASDLDPGIPGYLIAVATDLELGCPINFNYLIGDEYVKLTSGHAANLNAVAFATLSGAPVPCNSESGEAEIKFDGVQYNAAPRVLAVSNIPSPTDGNSMLLTLARLDGHLAGGSLSTIGQVFGLLYDDQEKVFSFEFTTTRRLFREVLSNTFPRTTPRLGTVIPTGRSGWLKLWRSSNDGALVGAILNFNANATSSSAAFNQGHLLHTLTLNTNSSLVIPVFPPNC
jgi:hypothetical protein